MADTTTSSSAERPVKDNQADVDIPVPTSTKDAPAVPSEELSSDPVNSTITTGNVTRVTVTITRVLTRAHHSDPTATTTVASAAPTATNDINGDNQDANTDNTTKKAKSQAQVDEGTQAIMS